MENESHQRVSDLLKTLPQTFADQEKISVKDLIKEIKEKGFGICLLIFCAIPALPIPAQGIATVLAIPVLILAAQMIYGRSNVWLPAFIHKRSISYTKLCKIANILIPYVKKFEYLSKPRLSLMHHPIIQRFVGIMIILCAVSMALPIPFSNTLPSIGIVIMALGLMERDGLAILGGMAIGIAGITVTLSIMYFGVEAVKALIGAIF